MNRKNLAFFIIIISVILLIINLYEIGFANLLSIKILNPISNILIILAMIFILKDTKKQKKELNS